MSTRDGILLQQAGEQSTSRFWSVGVSDEAALRVGRTNPPEAPVRRARRPEILLSAMVMNEYVESPG